MASGQHKALGRGIGALIPGAGASPASQALRTPDSAQDALGNPSPAGAAIPLDSIAPNPDQPRRTFDAEHLRRMSESILRHGVLQPVVVRRTRPQRHTEGQAGGVAPYELVCGEQRWRAAQLAGISSIPAVIADVDETERLELALIENVQRADLNPIELAYAFQALAASGSTQEQIGERVSLDRSTISNHLRLLELPREFQTDIEAGRLGIGHAKALLQVANPERRRHLRDRIVRESLSVRAAEVAARGTPVSRPKAAAGRPASDPNMQRLVDMLQRHLQTRVRINGDAERGRVEIEYFGSEDLDRITNALLAGT